MSRKNGTKNKEHRACSDCNHVNGLTMAVTEVFLVFVEEAFSKDLQFREMASQGKDLSGFKEFPHSEQSYLQSQTRTKPYETEKSTRAIEENARDYGMGLSM